MNLVRGVVQALPLVAAVIAGGILAAGISLPTDVPETRSLAASDALEGQSVHIYWYMGRASGFIAYGLLLASVVLGLALSSRIFDGLIVRPWVFEMHQFLSLYVIVAMAFHALILLPDPYAQFQVGELMVPFASPYRPIAVGLGAIVLYGSLIISVSFYMKRFIGQRGWRLLHYLTFALFIGAMVHGVFAGTDSDQFWAQYIYLASGLMVLFFTFFRILASRRIAAAGGRPRQAQRPDPPPPEMSPATESPT